MTRTVLFSWIGFSDIKSLKSKVAARESGDRVETVSNQGPIERVLRQYNKELPHGSGEDIYTLWRPLCQDAITEVYLWKAVTPPNRKNNEPPEDQEPFAAQKDEAGNFIKWLGAEFPQCSFFLECCYLKNPTDYGELYKFSEQQLNTFFNEHDSHEVTSICHVNSGTAQMQSTVLLLAKAKFTQLQLVKTSREAGLEWVDVPFDITVRYTPPFDAKGQDQHYNELLKASEEAMKEILGTSEVMKEVKSRAYLMAQYDGNILLRGETGTGKGLFAKEIHDASPRKKCPFKEVNCGAFPSDLLESELFGYVKGAFTGAGNGKEGKLMQANSGTLFLDEIGDLPLPQQVKILKILEQNSTKRKVDPVGGTRELTADVRIIAATNRPLEEMIQTGQFREDLYMRFGIASLTIPSLKELPEYDFFVFLDHFAKLVNVRYRGRGNYVEKQLTSEARQMLKEYSWPGNSRQLYMTLESIFLYLTPQKTAIVTGRIVSNAFSNFMIDNRKNDELDDILNRPLDDNFSIYELLNEVFAHYIIRAGKQVNHRSMAAIGQVLGFRGKEGSCGTPTAFRKYLAGKGKTYQVANNLQEKLRKSDEGRKILQGPE